MSINPKIHKIDEAGKPKCKVHNMTYCYAKTMEWNKVTCKRCLHRKANEERKPVIR